jgi:hypothetical protein
MQTERVTSAHNTLGSAGFLADLLTNGKAHENIHLKEPTERDRPGHDALLRCHRFLPLQHSRPRRQHSRGIFPITLDSLTRFVRA